MAENENVLARADADAMPVEGKKNDIQKGESSFGPGVGVSADGAAVGEKLINCGNTDKSVKMGDVSGPMTIDNSDTTTKVKGTPSSDRFNSAVQLASPQPVIDIERQPGQ